jgi:hypothetical protein
MSWRASLSPRFNEIRFFICRNSPKSAGLIQYLGAERNELLMLNPKLRLPITQRYSDAERGHYPARIKFYTADHKGGELIVDGLSQKEIEEKLKAFFEGVRDNKPQSVVSLQPLLATNENWKGDLIKYFRKHIGPIRREHE